MFAVKSTPGMARFYHDVILSSLPFLARLHFSAEELLLYPRRRRQRQRPRRRPQNVRANVKVLEF